MMPPTQPVLDVSLEPKEAIAPRETPEADAFVAMVERLAANPQVDVTKLEKILDLQERILDRNAKAEFDAAFARMQPDIPTILERARTDKTTYAPLEDIIEPLRPILAKHGFSIGFQTEWPTDKQVKVIGILTHVTGHARRSEFLSAADQTGSKNAIQALASSVSYGKRYVTKDLLCIVTRGEDDDAGKSGVLEQPESPKGYDDWVLDITATADQGTDALEKAWAASAGRFKSYLTKYQRPRWEAIKTRASGTNSRG